VTQDATVVDECFNVLRGALAELNRAYDDLVGFIERLLTSAFDLKGVGEEIRLQLRQRAEPLIDLAIETKLKGFFMRVCDEGLDDTGWLEAIGTYIAQKPPASWNDSDMARFEMGLSELARKFRHFEAVSYERRKWHDDSQSHQVGEPIRVGITTPHEPERERVVLLSLTDEAQVRKIEEAIEGIFESECATGNLEFRLAVLARISQKLMQRLEE